MVHYSPRLESLGLRLALRSYTFWYRISVSSGSSPSGKGEGGTTVQQEQKKQSVSEMVEEVLQRQAHYLVERNGVALEEARVSVASTEAGRQLRELGEGEHQYEEARYWQANLWCERATERVRQGRTT
jgi:hypothetical protein